MDSDEYYWVMDTLWYDCVISYAAHTGCPDWQGYLEGLI